MDKDQIETIKVLVVLAIVGIPLAFMGVRCVCPNYFPVDDDPPTIYDEYHHP